MAVPSATALRPGQVLVRQLWAGVNASDINYTDGRQVCEHSFRRRMHTPCRSGMQSGPSFLQGLLAWGKHDVT